MAPLPVDALFQVGLHCVEKCNATHSRTHFMCVSSISIFSNMTPISCRFRSRQTGVHENALWLYLLLCKRAVVLACDHLQGNALVLLERIRLRHGRLHIPCKSDDCESVSDCLSSTLSSPYSPRAALDLLGETEIGDLR